MVDAVSVFMVPSIEKVLAEGRQAAGSRVFRSDLRCSLCSSRRLTSVLLVGCDAIQMVDGA